MYGLPQDGMLAKNHLTKHLATYGYIPTDHTPGLWGHQTLPISFTLVVDNFEIKHVGRQHAKHLVAALAALYMLTTDWEGKFYCGPTLNWYYITRKVDITMPGYNPEALH